MQRKLIKRLFFFLLLCWSNWAIAQASTKTLSTSWGNYISTGIATNSTGFGNLLLQISITGQNSTWNGVFTINSGNSFTPNVTWNNARLISYSGYNAATDDVQALIMSNTASDGYGDVRIVLKTGTPASGLATITVVAVGQNAASLALVNMTTAPYAYTLSSSAGTYNTWTINKNFGIGTFSPKSLLDVGGELRLDKWANFPAEGSISEANWGNYIIGDASGSQRIKLGVSNDGYTRAEIFLDNSNRADGTIVFKTTDGSGNTGAQTRMLISGNGNVGIGTDKITDLTYGLYVEKGIRTRKVKVDMAAWADYVFAANYKLPSLQEVDAYIKGHQHLPDVPSEDEVQKQGVDIGNNQLVLLKKIEELTLYIIEQGKQIQMQKEEMAAQVQYQKQLDKKLEFLQKQLHAFLNKSKIR